MPVENSVSVTAGSATVTGYLTTFVAAEGDLFVLNGIAVAVLARPGTAELTLKHPWPGATLTDQTGWSLLPTGPYWSSAVTFNQRIVSLLNRIDTETVTLPTFTGKAGKVLKVNASATGLEWADDIQGSTDPTSDTTPDAFTFTDVTGATLSTVYTSNTITVAGINAAAPISITGGTYSKNGGAYTSASGTVVNGDTVAVRVTSSSANSTAASATLTIGGVSDTYSVTTVAAAGSDTTPDTFTFTDVTNATTSTVYTSNIITVAGVNAAAPISISGGTYSKNGGTYTSSAGTVVNGDTVAVRVTSASANSTAVNATLTIGGVSDTYTVTTAAAASDTTPDAFTFTDVTNATLSTVYTSNAITVAGINAAAAISISGGTYSKNGGAYTSAAGTVVNGDTVAVRVTSSASNSTAVNATLTIGGVADTFTVTTAASGATTLSALTLSSTNIIEASASGAVVGSVQGRASGSTLSIVDSAGNRFAISGGNLVAGATATDYFADKKHTITIRETLSGAGGSPRDTTFVIKVVPKTPSFSRIVENQTFTSVQTMEGTAWNNTLVRNCTFRNASGNGADIRAVTNLRIENCTFEDISGVAIRLRATSLSGAADSSTYDVQLYNNIIRRVGQNGISAAQDETANIKPVRLRIIGNQLTDVATTLNNGLYHGIYSQAPDVVIDDNTVINCADGNAISVRSTGKVRDNSVDGAGESCIKYYSDHMKGASDTLVIDGNTVKNWGVGAETNYGVAITRIVNATYHANTFYIRNNKYLWDVDTRDPKPVWLFVDPENDAKTVVVENNTELGATDPGAGGNTALFGIYGGYSSRYPNGARNYAETETMLGSTIGALVAFSDHSAPNGWGDGAGGGSGTMETSAEYNLAQHAGSGKKLIWSQACAMGYGAYDIFANSSMADVANGAGQASMTYIGNRLVAHGFADAIIRIGWEHNIVQFPWGNAWTDQNTHATAFIAAFRKVVDTFRAVAGNNFKFCWCPNKCKPDHPSTRVDIAYPGDTYVDYVGMDCYDDDLSWTDPQGYGANAAKTAAQRWSESVYGTTDPDANAGGGKLAWLATFAAAHSKQIIIGEWGAGFPTTITDAVDRPYALAKAYMGGDDGTYVANMMQYFKDNPVYAHGFYDIFDIGINFTAAAKWHPGATGMPTTGIASTTARAISTGSKTYTVASGLAIKYLQPVIIRDNANPNANYLEAEVTSYSGTTLTVNVYAVAGSGTPAAVTIYPHPSAIVPNTVAALKAGL